MCTLSAYQVSCTSVNNVQLLSLVICNIMQRPLIILINLVHFYGSSITPLKRLSGPNFGRSKMHWGTTFFECYKSLVVTNFGGPLRLSVAKPKVSEASQPSGRAIIEGP